MHKIGGLLGGVQIKLKMGKADDESANETTEEKKENPTQEQIQEGASEVPETTEDVESLRKVIKLNDTEEATEEPVKEEEDEFGDLASETENVSAEAAGSSREALEQKRVLLQRIKDFDLQIKKNQQDINSISEKIVAISKDLDDLVSLYEIVSEQMNPFVGLSKVTKKRLESFENINAELNVIKEKLSVLEQGKNLQINTPIETIVPIEPETIQEEVNQEFELGVTNQDLYQIIESSFQDVPPDNQLDTIIDEFIENLKAGNINMES